MTGKLEERSLGFRGGVLKDVIQSNTGCAIIVAGSESDKKHIDKIRESLDRYEIPYIVRICSGHKQPRKLADIIDEYNSFGGLMAYIAIAGGTDALSGEASFNANAPVISCPPDTRYADEEKYQNNFNESCLKNPPGSSNCYIARPENVGRFIAQMYAGVNPKFREILEKEKTKKIGSLEAADKEFLEGKR